jgi:hypothetical protein
MKSSLGHSKTKDRRHLILGNRDRGLDFLQFEAVCAAKPFGFSSDSVLLWKEATADPRNFLFLVKESACGLTSEP